MKQLNKVIKELKRKVWIQFSVKQVQIKFKNCVWQYKRISLLQKTTSRVKNFIQNKVLGQSLMQFYQFVTSRDFWQLHQAIKPTYLALASTREKVKKNEK